MSDAVYLKQFKWSKKCHKCGNEIAKGKPGFWDSENKLYYCANGRCYDIEAPPTSQPPSPQAERPHSMTPVLFYDPEQALKDCKKIAEKEYPDISPEARCYLVIELMREKYGMKWYEKPMM